MKLFSRVLFSALTVLSLTALLGSSVQAGSGDQPPCPQQQQAPPYKGKYQPTPAPTPKPCPQQQQQAPDQPQKPYQPSGDSGPYQPKAPR